MKRPFAVLRLVLCFSALFAALAAHAGEREIVLEKQDQGCRWIMRSPAKAGIAQVILSLRDHTGKPAGKRAVSGELLMPHMSMPGYPLKLEFQETENGVYAALVQYEHAGVWRIAAVVRDEDGRESRQVFDLDIAP